MPHSFRRPVAAVGLVALVGLAACGGGGGDEDAASTAPADTSAPTTTAVPALATIFEDDFTADASGWGEGSTDAFTTSFTDAGYRVGITDTASFFGYADDGPLGVGDSATTVTVVEAQGGARPGVTCRLNRTGPTAYYTLTASPVSGDYAISRWSAEAPSDPEVLTEGTDPGLVGDALELTGACRGAGDGEPVDLTLLVGGAEVATVTDRDGLPAGITGIAVDRGSDPEGSATFGGIRVEGDEGDGGLSFEDDFSDPGSGFLVAQGGGGTVAYDDGVLGVEAQSALDVPVPIRPPFPSVGTATVSVDGDLTAGYAGLCLGGDDGQYEFALSADGYASIGRYPADGSDFVLLDEVTGAFPATGPWRLSAGWNTDGSSTNLDLFVDDQRLVSVNDDAVTAFRGLSLCGTVAQSSAADATISYTYDDLVLVGDPG